MPSDGGMRTTAVFCLALAFACGGGTDAAGPTDNPKFAYACSDDSLYKVDIATHAINPIGPLTGCYEAAIISDIAVDMNGTIYACSTTTIQATRTLSNSMSISLVAAFILAERIGTHRASIKFA